MADKKKVLGLVHGGYSSHTIRVVEVGKALSETGDFDVAFSGSGPHIKLAEETGLRCIRTPVVDMRQVEEEVAKFIPRIYTKRDSLVFFAEEDNLLEEEKPDIIVRDSLREFAGISSKVRGIFDVHIQQANLTPHYRIDFKPPGFPKLVDAVLPKGSLKPFARIIEKAVKKSAT